MPNQLFLFLATITLSVFATTPESGTAQATPPMGGSSSIGEKSGGLPPDLSGPEYKGLVRIAKPFEGNASIGLGGWAGRYWATLEYQWLARPEISLGIMPIFGGVPNSPQPETALGALITSTFYGFGSRPFGGAFVVTGIGGLIPFGEAYGNGDALLRLASLLGIGWSFSQRNGLTASLGLAAINSGKTDGDGGSLTGTAYLAFAKVGFRH